MLLIGDIGGTNTRVAVLPLRKGKPLLEKKVKSAEHATFRDALNAALGTQHFKLTAACFGIAGPVVNNRCTATNLPWKVDGDALGRALKVPRVKLVNDLVALAFGATQMTKRNLVPLNGTQLPKPNAANLAIVAAGTGLGEAALVWDSIGERYVAMGTEGGHSDYAPRNALEDEVRAFLAARHGRVSTERVLSGPGLKALYEFFRDVKKLTPGVLPNPAADFLPRSPAWVSQANPLSRARRSTSSSARTAPKPATSRCATSPRAARVHRRQHRGRAAVTASNLSVSRRVHEQGPLLADARDPAGRAG